MKVEEARELIDRQLEKEWDNIFENPNPHVHRARIVTAVFNAVRDEIEGSCELAPVCKFYKVT